MTIAAALLLGAADASNRGTDAASISVQREGRATLARAAAIQEELETVVARVDIDVSVAYRPFSVKLFGVFERFSSEEHRFEGVSPEGDWDAAGNIVHGVLPLFAQGALPAHQLAHIYSEWVFDGLLNNTTDRQPTPAWLYDGLAEVEASRVAPYGPCILRGHDPIPLSRLRTPASWWRVRASGQAALEYCEAQTRARALVSAVGWRSVLWRLKHSGSWRAFAQWAVSFAV